MPQSISISISLELISRLNTRLIWISRGRARNQALEASAAPRAEKNLQPQDYITAADNDIIRFTVNLSSALLMLLGSTFVNFREQIISVYQIESKIE